MKIICLGDSNTYGYDPRSFFGGRYDKTNCWVDVLAEKTGWEICNRGENGREIPSAPVSVSEDTDLLIVMLGSNDLLQGLSPETVAGKMEQFLAGLQLEREKILLIAPPPMAPGEWVHDDGLINASVYLGSLYQTLAVRLGILFADAGKWDVELAYDGVHFTEQGHRAFADSLFKEINK